MSLTPAAGALAERLKRLLVYLPNTTGIGHEIRTIALLTGLRHHVPHCEQVVVAGTSVTEQFTRHEIEILRLPGLRGSPTTDELVLSPRYMQRTTLADVLRLRASLLAGVFDTYRPDLVMIDHQPMGLAGEILPWLMRKRAEPNAFLCVQISRGLIADAVHLQPPYRRPQRGVDVIDLGGLYDRVFVFDRPDNLPPALVHMFTSQPNADRVCFLDQLTIKTHAELRPPEQTRQWLGLSGADLVTVNIGHPRDADAILTPVVTGFEQFNHDRRHEMLIVLSPFMAAEAIESVHRRFGSAHVHVRQFIPDLVDVWHASSAAICRAGYNTVAELRLTGCPALLIPEDYGSGEQLWRAQHLPSTQFRSTSVLGLTAESVARDLAWLMTDGRERCPVDIDKYAVAADLLNELSRRTRKEDHAFEA